MVRSCGNKSRQWNHIESLTAVSHGDSQASVTQCGPKADMYIRWVSFVNTHALIIDNTDMCLWRSEMACISGTEGNTNTLYSLFNFYFQSLPVDPRFFKTK